MSASEQAFSSAPPAAFVQAIARAEVRRRRRLLTVALSLLLVPVAAAAAFYAWGKEDVDSIAAGVREVERDIKSDLKSDLAPIRAAVSDEAIASRVNRSVEGALQEPLKEVAALDAEVRGFPGRVAAVEASVKPVVETVTKIDARVKEIGESVAKVKTLVGDESVESRVTKAVASSNDGLTAGFDALNAKWTKAAKASDILEVKAEIKALAADRGGAAAARAAAAEAVRPLQESLGEFETRFDDGKKERQTLSQMVGRLQEAANGQAQAIATVKADVERLASRPAPGVKRVDRRIGTVSAVSHDRTTCTVHLEDPGADAPAGALLAVRRPQEGGALVGYVRLVTLFLEHRPSPPPSRSPTRTAKGFGDSLEHVRVGDSVEVDLGG